MGFVPNISPTERQALDSGSVWIEKEFFKGRPNFKNLFSQPFPKITEQETSFINKETSQLCAIANEWNTFKSRKISDEVLEFIKKNKFLGMIIPKKYNGLEFSPAAHSKVIEKISSINVPVAIFTMVPNSLGPAELLLKYGTEPQKEKYLYNLAVGKEIPCFGLTEPQAGSDASSILSKGILFKGQDGKLRIKIHWNKRWISLSAIATILGVAFQLEDPDEILGKGKDVGITCALIPSETAGVKRGFYHDPMGVPFYNAPMEGENVEVLAEEAIIGGLEQAGNGWQMLMECLGVGRGISLPSLSIGTSSRIARIVSCHSSIRKQFNLPIGQFEGVEEVLARIAGLTYLMRATQNFTLSALNQGINATITTAITKYNLTEMARQVALDGMDIMAGAGISLGPKNFIASIYNSIPIAITVEGANILTRSLIIYGQGALRSHPFAYKEIKALEKNDFLAFDRVFWKHLYQIICNTVRFFILSIFRGYTHISPSYLGKGHRYIQKIAWSSIMFSWLTNIALFVFGSQLKIKEKLTGRFADLLSYQYMATAILWNWRCKGKSKTTWPAVKWSLDYCFYQIQVSVENILLNFHNPVLSFPARTLIYFLLRLNSIGAPPSDKLSKELSYNFLNNLDLREDLFGSSHLPENSEHQIRKLEDTYHLIKKCEKAVKKIRQAVKRKELPKKRTYLLLDLALQQEVISKEEHGQIKEAEEARRDVIQVDSFTESEYFS